MGASRCLAKSLSARAELAILSCDRMPRPAGGRWPCLGWTQVMSPGSLPGRC